MEFDKSRLVLELKLRDSILAAADRHSQATYQRDTPWFLIASSWFHAWVDFLQCFTSTVPRPAVPPGEVRLTSLLDDDPKESRITTPDNPFNVTLKPKIVIGRDYMVLDQVQWDYLSTIYRAEGGLEIKRFGPSARAVRLYAKVVKGLFTCISGEEVMSMGPFVYRCHPEITAQQLVDLLKACPDLPDFVTNAVRLKVSIIPQGVYANLDRAGVYDRELLLRNNDLDLTTDKWVEKILKPNSLFIVKGLVLTI